jgi:hypothetical protein
MSGEVRGVNAHIPRPAKVWTPRSFASAGKPPVRLSRRRCHFGRRKWPLYSNQLRSESFSKRYAEELGLTSTSVATKHRQQAVNLGAPAAKSLGLTDDWLITVIGGVGNYAEIFNRNLGPDTPLELNRGMNALWTQGGVLYAPPMH